MRRSRWSGLHPPPANLWAEKQQQRKRKESAAGRMNLQLAHSLLQLQAAGFAEASLANAPLANVARRYLPRVAYALTRLHTSGGLLQLLFRR